MSSFSSLRSRAKEKTEVLKRSFEQLSGNAPRESQDSRFWYPERNEDGNASAIIRFLPAPEGETDDYIQVIRHDFTGPGGRYSEKSLRTIDKSDPVAKLNAEDWKRGEAGQLAAKQRVRKKSYYTNIYVIRDTNHPENEGKVFLYRFGQQLYDMIHLAMYPIDPEDIKINPFSPFAPPKNASVEEIKEWVEEYGYPGANFRVKVMTKQGEDKYADYSASKFDYMSPLGTDDEIDRICGQAYKLKGEFHDPSKFKSYEELEARLFEVLGYNRPVAVSSHAQPQAPAQPAVSTPLSDDFDSDLSEFQRLLDEDV
jgi:hypothetical protein